MPGSRVACESAVSQLSPSFPYRVSHAVTRAGQEVQGALRTLNREVVRASLGVRARGRECGQRKVRQKEEAVHNS